MNWSDYRRMYRTLLFFLLSVFLLCSGWSAYAQFTEIPTNGSQTGGSVTFHNQKLYKFRVQSGMFYRVNLAPGSWEDLDLYGHYNTSVSQANGVNNHGFSCRANDGLEHFAFESNYGGYYYLAVYAYNQDADFYLNVQESALPALSLQSPSPTGTWTIGQNAYISWSGDFDDYRIRISRNGGSWQDLVNPVNGLYYQTDSPYTWTVTGPAASSCRIHVLGRSVMYSERTVPYTVKGVWHTPGEPPTGVSTWEVRIVEGQAQDHLEIEGSKEVTENNNMQYTCKLVRLNGSFQDVTNSSHWAIEYGPASIISNSGYLTAYDVTYDQQCRIRASYNGLSAPYDLTIRNSTGTLNSIVVTGPSQLNENTSEQYYCRAYYADGTNADITSSANWSDGGCSYADISAAGVLTASEVSSNQSCTLTATYQGKTSSLGVTVRDLPPVTPPAPTLVSPAPNLTTTTRNITFRWNPVPGATAYYFRLDKGGGGWYENQDTLPAGTTEFSTEFPVLNGQPLYDRYIWKVRAANAPNNWSAWSEVRSIFYRSPENLVKNQQNQFESVEPVNTFSGAYLYSHQDLSIPARGLPIEFARFYSSKADGAPLQMAPRWRHTYQVSLVENPGDGAVTIHWANCSEDYFTPDPENLGQYTNTYAGYSGKLTKKTDGAFDFRTKALITYHFDASGTLLSMADRNGNAITLLYDSGVLAAVRDAAGREITFEYSIGGRLTKVTDFASPQRTLEFTYDAITGDLLTATDVLGHSIQYTYDPLYPDGHYMKTIVDRRGYTIVTNVYDAEGRVTNQTNARGKTWAYAYTPEGITTETDPQEPTRGVTTYQYDEHSWLVKKTDPEGHYEQYAYDANGNRTTLDNARRKITTYTYDAHGNVLTATNALGQVTTFEYNVNDQVTLSKDPLNRETRFDYDERGNLIAVRKPLNHITQYVYDPLGQLLTETDAMGRVTAHAYDTVGNRITTTNALGQITQFAYDALGRLTSTIEPNAQHTDFTYFADGLVETITDQETNQTRYGYDENGNRTLVRNPRGTDTLYAYNENNLLGTVTDAYAKTTVTGYDAVDRVASVTDRWGKTTSFTYDLAGNRTKSIAPDTTETSFSYDENGNQTSVTNANNNSTLYQYDELDRVWKVSDATGNTTENTYDAAGRLIKVKDANGKETEYTYDELDRLTQLKDPLNGTLVFSYDLNGNRLSITDPNSHVTLFEYDALNRVVAETDPLGKGYRYEYDSAGNRVKRTDTRNNVTTYDYYANHKLKTIYYPGTANTVAFTYDPNGNRLTMTDANGPTAWSYDDLDRITTVLDPFGNAVGYAYDLPSEVRKRIVYPGSKNVDYTFDDNGRLASLTDWAGHTFTYTYDAAGNVAQLAYPNGCKEKRTYYTNERMKTLTHEKPDASQFIAYTYYYDGIGNITSMDRDEAVAREFTPELTNYTYNNGNEIQTAGPSTFSFDGNGNQIKEMKPTGTTQYLFDFENRLTQITPSSGTASQFTYTGLGDRITSNEGAAKRYLLDLNKNLTDVLADLDGSNTPQQYYLYGLGLVGRVTPAGDLIQYHPDHLGSIMAVTDQTSTITAAFSYDEFGAVASSAGSEAGPWRFCGAIGLQETATGVQFVRARYYDNQVARFLEHDSIRDYTHTQTFNLYPYVKNDPLSNIDSSGRSIADLSNKDVTLYDIHLGNGIIIKAGTPREVANRLAQLELDRLQEQSKLAGERAARLQQGIDDIKQYTASSISLLTSWGGGGSGFLLAAQDWGQTTARLLGHAFNNEALVAAGTLPPELQTAKTVAGFASFSLSSGNLISAIKDPTNIVHQGKLLTRIGHYAVSSGAKLYKEYTNASIQW